MESQCKQCSNDKKLCSCDTTALPTAAMMTVMYGGAPDPTWPYPGRPTPNVPVTTPVYTLSTKQKVTVAARIDENGKLWLRISVDGVHIAEVEGSTTATLTVEV